MRKPLAECKDWVVVLHHGGYTTVMESYTKWSDARKRRDVIERRGYTTSVVSREFAMFKEMEGKLAWNKTTPY